MWAFAAEREGQTSLRLSEIRPIVPQATPALAVPSPTPSPPPTFLSAWGPGPLWVNLAQPWPENRVISYSSNPPLSHHAIKYASQPLTSQVRATPPCSSNAALPAPTWGTHKEDRGQDSLAAELHRLISIVTVKFEEVLGLGFKLLKLVSVMRNSLRLAWGGKSRNKIIVVRSCPARPQNPNSNVCSSETWEAVKCSTCTSPNTVYVENGGKLFPSPRKAWNWQPLSSFSLPSD